MKSKGRRLTIVAATAVGLLALPGAASAAPIADATCTGPISNTPIGTGNFREARTFTATLSGRLVLAQMNLSRTNADPGGNYTLRISDQVAGAPTNKILGTGSIPLAAVPDTNTPTLATGSFSDPAVVERGKGYALIITKPGAGANAVRINNTDNANCPGDNYFFSFSQAAPFQAGLGVGVPISTVYIDAIPTVEIGKHPKKKTRNRKAKFTFFSNEPDATFLCKLDRKKAKPCEKRKAYRKLKRKKHKLSVEAVDSTGGHSAPAVFKWKVKRRR